MRYALILAVALAAGAPPIGGQPAATILVRLSNFSFSPDTIRLHPGQAYVLRMENSAGGGHDFTAREFFAAATIATESRRWIVDGTVEVPAGESREIALTAPAAGRYKVRCTHRFHRLLGMSGSIVVG